MPSIHVFPVFADRWRQASNSRMTELDRFDSCLRAEYAAQTSDRCEVETLCSKRRFRLQSRQ